MSYTLYPAIDVREGRVVRLKQGDYTQETRYGEEPLALARRYAEEGAQWLHLVDLDAARAGGYTLALLLESIVAETGLHVQTGGGVREGVDIARMLSAGADRVVVGSLAVRDPRRVTEWIAHFGADRIVVALDTRADADGVWRLPLHGWTEASNQSLHDRLDHYLKAGLRHMLCTDIARDGMLVGPNLALYRELHASAPMVALQASGGVRDLADLAAVRATGCTGVVLGKALLDGRFELADALAATESC